MRAHEPDHPLPDAGRANVGLVLVGTWRTGPAKRQVAAIEAVRQASDQMGRPRGLLSYTALAASDETTVVQYSQWADESAARRFVTHRKAHWPKP